MNDAVLIALIAIVPTTLAGFAALVAAFRNGRKLDVIHVLVNSKMSEALDRIIMLEERLGIPPDGDIPPGEPGSSIEGKP